MIYRWIISLYFLAWLVPTGIADENGGPKYFIYLTNWAFLLFNLYLLVSAIAVTLQFVVHYSYDKENLSHDDLHQRQQNLHDKHQVIRTLLGADYTHKVVWYQKVQWLLITIGLEMAVGVSVLYWVVVYSSEHKLNGENFNVHLVNGIVALFDVCFSGIIIRLAHVVYLFCFGAVYVIFTGIYFAADGTNAQDKPYIYAAIDYGEELGLALLYVFIIILVFLPILHFAIYALYGARRWLVKTICRTNESDLEAVNESGNDVTVEASYTYHTNM